MKKRLLAFCIFLFFNIPFNAAAQHGDDTLIRHLEHLEKEAILKGDTAMLSKLMSARIVVQNPENMIVNFSQIMNRVTTRKINYASFERNIEKISFFGNVSVVMGTETLVPQGETKNAGKTVTRKFTNIWIKEDNVWKLTARQATNISII